MSIQVNQKKKPPLAGEVGLWEWLKIGLYLCWLSLLARDKKGK